MKVGITLPQGCDREYLGLDGRTAWERTVEVARQADALGFESLWLYDHFQVDPPLDRGAGLRAVRRARRDRRRSRRALGSGTSSWRPPIGRPG